LLRGVFALGTGNGFAIRGSMRIQIFTWQLQYFLGPVSYKFVNNKKLKKENKPIREQEKTTRKKYFFNPKPKLPKLKKPKLFNITGQEQIAHLLG
jgi:hypothetical protein